MKTQPTRKEVFDRKLQILQFLRQHPGSTISNIAIDLRMPRNYVSWTIKTMTEDGLVNPVGKNRNSLIYRNARGAFHGLRMGTDKSSEKAIVKAVEKQQVKSKDKMDFMLVHTHMVITVDGEEYFMDIDDLRRLYRTICDIPGIEDES